jgi:phosphonopyruvate decarboxylase
MVPVSSFWSVLKRSGYTFFSGVPCSILKPILNIAFKDPRVEYIPAVKENIALGIASGAYLAGKKSGIFIQNSGLGNITNALTSFNLLYKIPVLMFITWRGYKMRDAPEHILMGAKTLYLLNTLEIPTKVLGNNYIDDISWAISQLETKSIPVAIILREGIVI